ncbi:hypothetical protein E4U61_004217 [Claviceps capensis]|nr:hypothetical protein E4U61_004217 [Claviceps capensis]
MADFSRYGGVSDEWGAAEKSWTSPTLGQGLPLVELRKVKNKEREEASAMGMEVFKDLVRMQNHSIATRDGSGIETRSYRLVSAADEDRLPVFFTFIPTAWDDAEDGFAWLHQNIGLLGGHPDKVIVGGISAGAQLTASLVLGKNMGKVLLPLAKLKDPALSSYKQCQDAPILSAKSIRVFSDLLQSGTPDLSDLRMSPGNASVEHVRGMPPTTFGVARVDPLRDEALLYSELLAEAGVSTDTYVFEGVPHAFSRFPQLSQTKRWDVVLYRSVQWSLSRPKPGASVVKTERP